MITQPLLPLIVQDALQAWLFTILGGNFSFTIDPRTNLMTLFSDNTSAISVFQQHGSIAISADGAPLNPIPYIGQRGNLPAYSLSAGNILTVNADCDTFRLWLWNNSRLNDVTPVAPGDTWDGLFDETIPGIFVLEGRKTFASGFIMVEVTEA